MIYSDLILNTKNWGHIYRAWKNNRLPHALLFHGPTGIGKEAHAIELAALLNCADIQNERACGTCPSCKKIISFQHECVKLILPLPRGKIASSNDSYMKAFKNEKVFQEYLDMLKEKGNNPYASLHVSGSSTILINSIREMKQNISMSMEKDQWKIILIFQAEKLCVPNPAAAHALLKILEEPPDQTIMILVSSKSDSIIDTIHSVKGGEANHVVLYGKGNFPSNFKSKTKQEKIDEKKVWYTGATRARDTIHLLTTDYKYNYPLGADYLVYVQEQTR